MIYKFNNKTELSQSTETDGLIVVLTNGDREALQEIINKWGFLNEESFLKFAMAIMLKAEGNKIIIQSEGNQASIVPNDNLLRPKNAP